MKHIRIVLRSWLFLALLVPVTLAHGQGAGACRADKQRGGDASSKINACFTQINWNGIVDATALTGAQTLSGNMFSNMPYNAPVNITVYFGNATYRASATQRYDPGASNGNPESIRLIGVGGNLYDASGTVFKWTGSSTGSQAMFVLYNIENLLVQAITFDGNAAASKAMVYAGTSFHPDGGAFVDVVTKGFRIYGTDPGIDTLGSYGWGAQNVHFYNSSIFGGAVGLLVGSTEVKTFGGNFGGEAGIQRPAAPKLTTTPGGALPAATYYAEVTYVNSLGDTYISPEVQISVPANSLLLVNSPPSNPPTAGTAPGALGWNAYVSASPAIETRQTSSPIPLGTNWTEPTSGLISGQGPPAFNTTGSLAAVAFSTSSSLQMVSPTFIGYGTAFLDVANSFVGLIRVQNGWFENDGYLLRRNGSGSDIFVANFSCIECHIALHAKYAIDTTGLSIPSIVLFGGYADAGSNTNVNLADGSSGLVVFGPDASQGWSTTGAGAANFWQFQSGSFDGASPFTFKKGVSFMPTSDPSCGPGQYFIWASSASNALKICSNGRVTSF